MDRMDMASAGNRVNGYQPNLTPPPGVNAPIIATSRSIAMHKGKKLPERDVNTKFMVGQG